MWKSKIYSTTSQILQSRTTIKSIIRIYSDTPYNIRLFPFL